MGRGILRRTRILLGATLVLPAPAQARAAACKFGYPVGVSPESPAPLINGHPVNGTNLYDQYGYHLGADYWSGGGCTSYGETVYAVADGTVVEIVDDLGSYLDVVVIRHEVPGVGNVYAMYGHISRDPNLAEGQAVSYRQPIGFIDDVLQYFSPCHVHFELLNETAYQQGPFCTGCENAGYHVSPGYDKKQGTEVGYNMAGDKYIEVVDGIDGNRWYFTDEFIDARLDATCGTCGDATCDPGESYDTCPQDCPACALVPPDGAVLDESGPCFEALGSPQYWYPQVGVGYEGNLLYTHTTASDTVDNYGIWNLVFEQAGTYRLSIWSEPGWGQSTMARYEIVHAGSTSEVVVDQSAGGAIELGTFAFEAGGGQWVRLDDNTGEPLADMVQIVFDALIVEPAGGAPGTTGGTGGSGDGGPATGTGATDADGSGGPTGTSTAATAASAGATGGAATDASEGGALPPTYGGEAGRGCACSGGAVPVGPGFPPWVLLPLLQGSATSRKRCLRRTCDRTAASPRRWRPGRPRRRIGSARGDRVR